MKRQISKKAFSPPTRNCSSFFFLLLSRSSFFFSKPSGLMNDVGKLLWALTSYIVFVLVHLYRRLSKRSSLQVSQVSNFLYIARRHFVFMIVVRKTPYFVCYAVTWWLHNWWLVSSPDHTCGLWTRLIDGLHVPCCAHLAIFAVVHWWPLLLTVVCI